MKASDLFIRALEAEGVEHIFGIPGEENLDFLDSLRDSPIQLILTRHEQAAGFMAATYGRLTGRGVSVDPGTWSNKFRHRCRLCPVGCHADDDDHRSEADQDE